VSAEIASFCQADRSKARRFAVASPRFIGRRSVSTVLSQDCLGRPILRLQVIGGPEMQAWRARWGCLGRRCEDVQRRTDGDCRQCLTRTAAQCCAGAYPVVGDKFSPMRVQDAPMVPHSASMSLLIRSLCVYASYRPVSSRHSPLIDLCGVTSVKMVLPHSLSTTIRRQKAASSPHHLLAADSRPTLLHL